DPPFYYWLALAFAKPLGDLLGFHNAVRLASGFAVLVSTWFLFLAGRKFEKADQKQGISASAPLLLIGSVGLMVHAHEAVPDLATLAAICAGLFFLFSSSLFAGLGFGVSLGIAFLSAGPVMPAVLFATALLAHAVCDEWRNLRAARFLLLALAAFALVAASWPIALALRAPELAQAWGVGASY